MDAHAALAELAGLSTQVTRAVVVGPGGGVEGALGADGEHAARLARTGEALLAAAGGVPHGGEAAVARVEVTTPAGGVFVVCEGDRTVVATTVPGPTAGLVVYDLRAVLRRMAEGAA